MKPIPEDKLQQFKDYLAANPNRSTAIIARWKAKGFDVTPLSDKPLLSDVADEVEGFGRGVPEGLSWDLVSATGNDPSYKLPEDIPLVGGLSPSRELGRVVGGIPHGGWLGRLAKRATGYTLSKFGAAVAPGVATFTQKLIGKAVAPAVGTLAAALPEGVVGAVTTGLREGNVEDGLRALPEWMAIGVGFRGAHAAATKTYKYLKSVNGRPVTPEIQGRLDQLAGEMEQEANAPRTAEELSAARDAMEARLKREGSIRALGQEVGELTDKVKQGYTVPGDGAHPANKDVYYTNGGEIDVNPLPPKDYAGPIYRNRRVIYTDEVGATTFDGKEFKVNRKALEARYRNRSWATPVEGRIKIEEHSFKNYQEWEDFSMERAYQAKRNPRLSIEPSNNYYNRVTKAAMRTRARQVVNKMRPPEGPAGVEQARVDAEQEGVRADARTSEARAILAVKERDEVISLRALAPRKAEAKPLADLTGNPEVKEPKMVHERLNDLRKETGGWSEQADEALATLSVEQKEFFLDSGMNIEDLPDHRNKIIEGQRKKELGLSKAAFFDKELDRALGADDAPGKEVPLGSLISLSRSGQTFRGIVRGTKGGSYQVEPEKGGKVRGYQKSKWEVTVIQAAVSGGSELPGGLGPATPEQRMQLATMIEDLRKMGPDFAIDPMRLVGENLTSARAVELIGNLQEDLTHQATRYYDRLLEDMGASTRERGGVSASDADLDLLEINPRWGLPPSSQFGLSANPVGKQLVNFSQDVTEEGQARLLRWREKYNEVRDLVGIPRWSIGANSKNPRTIAQHEAGRQRLFDLARAVEAKTGNRLPDEIARDPQMVKAYRAWHSLMNQIAADIGLPPGRRVASYMTHIFLGKTGKWRAGAIANTMTPDQAAMLTKLVSNLGDVPDLHRLVENVQTRATLAEGKGFSSLKHRTGHLDEFEFDLDLIFNTYSRGANDYIVHNKILAEAHALMEQVPLTDRKGTPLRIRSEMKNYVEYVIGKPSDARVAFAKKVSDGDGIWGPFQRGIDRMIEIIGGGQRGILAMARAGDTDEALNFLSDLQEAARTRGRTTGIPTGNLRNNPVGHLRAKTALYLDDMREALGDPRLAGPIAQRLYRVQMIAKLALNGAQGLVNLSQLVTNTNAVLGSRYTSRGVYHYLFNGAKDKPIHGHKVIDILEESGVTLDISRTEEFIELSPGSIGKAVQDWGMTPSRFSEQLNRGSTLLAAYEKAMDGGSSHLAAIGYARQVVEKTQFAFNRAGTPGMLRGPLVRLFLMFKSYPIHQINFTAEMFANALNKGEHAQLARHLLGYIALVGGSAQVLGLLGKEGETNIPERFQHPAIEMTTEYFNGLGRRGPLGSFAATMGGPFGDTMESFMDATVKLAHNEVKAGLLEAKHGLQQLYVPMFLQRAARGETDPISLLGFKKKKPKSPFDIPKL